MSYNSMSWHRNSDRFNDSYGEYNENNEKRCGNCCSCCCNCTLKTSLVWIFSTLLGLALFLFILVFVIFPIVFMYSYSLQRAVMFPNFDQPSNPEYNNFEKYGAVGVRNIYVNVMDTDNTSIVSLGVWHVLPERLKSAPELNPNFDFDAALMSSADDIIIYFHGNSGTRIHPLPTYEVLRKYFHVIAVDYRNYGDSTTAELSEAAVVNDLQQFYKWVREKTSAKIYVWAHSLGTSLSAHTLSVLNGMDFVPMGLVLEAPFSTMREEIAVHPIGKIFAWLAYFDSTIRDPLEANGFHFWTTTYILNVSCPIMIVHAEDDSIIPYSLSQKLSNVASENRDTARQGNVTYHLIEAKHRANHMNINQVPELPSYLEEFKSVCEAYNLGKN